MSLFNRLRERVRKTTGVEEQREQRTAVARDARAIHFTLVAREWDKPDEAGAEDVWGRGFMLHDEQGIAWAWDDLTLAELGVWITKVAGVSHYEGALQHEGFTPGRRLSLVADPTNPYDSNAVGVWDAERRRQVGHVPRDLAARLSGELQAGAVFDAFCLWEWVTKPDARRVGLRVLIGPSGAFTVAE